MSSRKARGRVADILDALMASPRPLSAYDLIATIGPRVPASPPTIYRALKKLISDGKVHRIEFAERLRRMPPFERRGT